MSSNSALAGSGRLCESGGEAAGRQPAATADLLSYMDDLILELMDLADKAGDVRLNALLEASHREIEVRRHEAGQGA